MSNLWFYMSIIGFVMVGIAPWVCIFVLFGVIAGLKTNLLLLENGQKGRLELLNRVIAESSENLSGVELLGKRVEKLELDLQHTDDMYAGLVPTCDKLKRDVEGMGEILGGYIEKDNKLNNFFAGITADLIIPSMCQKKQKRSRKHGC